MAREDPNWGYASALVGPGFLGLIEVCSDGPLVSALADLALFTVLFTDAGRLSVREPRAGWRLSGPRSAVGTALGLGMPLSLVLVAVAAHYLVGLDWITALLVGVTLSPTDPVFASAIVRRADVPLRLRRLLKHRCGVNDGLALPFVLVFLALATGAETGLGEVALELMLGVVFGVVLTLAVTALFRLPVLGSEPKLQATGPARPAHRVLRAVSLPPTPPTASLSSRPVLAVISSFPHTRLCQCAPMPGVRCRRPG